MTYGGCFYPKFMTYGGCFYGCVYPRLPRGFIVLGIFHCSLFLFEYRYAK
jgi:hypothetical protein